MRALMVLETVRTIWDRLPNRNHPVYQIVGPLGITLVAILVGSIVDHWRGDIVWPWPPVQDEEEEE